MLVYQRRVAHPNGGASTEDSHTIVSPSMVVQALKLPQPPPAAVKRIAAVDKEHQTKCDQYRLRCVIQIIFVCLFP